MDLKAAAAGALAGAGACGAVWWLVEHNSAARALSDAPAATAASTLSQCAPTKSEKIPAAIAQPIESQNSVNSEARPPGGPASDKRLCSSADSSAKPSNLETAVEEFPTEISTAARSERQKEARDLGWSYTMEQMLRQYLANHKAASQFDIALVECRTSFCEIEAHAYSEDAWIAWMQIIQDVKNQPWSDFGSTGSSSEARLGRPLFVATFFRLQQKAN